MPTTAENKFTVTTSPCVNAGIAEFAAAHNLDHEEAAEILIRDRLIELGLPTGGGLAQIVSEKEVMAFVEGEVETLQNGPWDEQVTLEIFRRIKQEIPDVYAKAVGGDAQVQGHPDKGRVNRRVGRRTKRLLKAEVLTDAKGKPRKGYPPAEENAYIRSYTLLGPGKTSIKAT